MIHRQWIEAIDAFETEMRKAVDSDCNGCKKGEAYEHGWSCFFNRGIVLEEQESSDQEEKGIADVRKEGGRQDHSEMIQCINSYSG
jgi:hypothetical protein